MHFIKSRWLYECPSILANKQVSTPDNHTPVKQQHHHNLREAHKTSRPGKTKRLNAPSPKVLHFLLTHSKRDFELPYNYLTPSWQTSHVRARPTRLTFLKFKSAQSSWLSQKLTLHMICLQGHHDPFCWPLSPVHLGNLRSAGQSWPPPSTSNSTPTPPKLPL